MKKTFIYIFSLLLALPTLNSCDDEVMPDLLPPIEDEGNAGGGSDIDDDIDVSLLEPGFNLNPKAETEELPDADQPLDIYFNANGLKVETDNGEEDSPLLGYDKDCYLHTGVISEGTWMYVPAEWNEDTEKCKMKLVKENVWKITLSPSIREWYGSGTTPIERLGLIIRTSDGVKGLPQDYFADSQDNKYNGFTPGETTIKSMPEGLDYGINVLDNSTVALVLYEKDKNGQRNYDYAYVMGDFNNWKRVSDETSQMYYDDAKGCWWLTLSGLDANKEYAFQYYLGKKSTVEGEKDIEMRLADPYTEKILDAGSDPYIPEYTYPSAQRVYPTKGAGVVSTFKINKDNYPWANDDYRIKNKNSLVIYELLLRDFTETKDLNGAIQKLDYLQDLGVTAIELMPVQEFDGNNSWGYNPCFYFALDKAYGTKQMYKKFIDECHKRDMAVILDVVYNHATGAHPFARLYWDSDNNKTASNNPWFNVDAPHGFSVFHDFNHTQPMVRQFIKRNLEFLMDEYHVDGFRFDLTKGFTQNLSGDDYGYNQERIDILKDYYYTIKSKREDALMICEHWCDPNEENVLALAGMMCWRKANEQYYQAGMGWQDNSGFDDMFSIGGFPTTQGGWVSFFESHDEERASFKAKTWGTESVKSDIQTRMNSMAALAAFTFTVPGPKMIWQGGELGFDTALLNYTEGEDSEKGKTDEKPIDWSYLTEPARKSLHDAYSAILNLRKGNPELFDSNSPVVYNVDKDSWGGGRKIEVSSIDGKKLWVVGFFCDTENLDNKYHTLPTGWDRYYNVITGETEEGVGGIPADITEGHNFKIYTNFVPNYNN